MFRYSSSISQHCLQGAKRRLEWLVLAGADVNALVDSIPMFEPQSKECRSRRRRIRHTEGTWPRYARQACLQTLDESTSDIRMILTNGQNLKEISSRQELMIYLLLRNGANVNEAEGCTKTPLHIAVK
ncbi:unnamed protein product [Aspergillus oryzae]|nr:unnamed protein product [Aspergillus oryzae]GMF90414.1 unnamed protein product [Aspergillus oryzae]